ncbi:MAG: amino acid adenylation domain-containing protein, partial [Vicinamibacterales bacterium]
PVRYLDFAVAHRRWLDGPRLQAQLAYWRGQLAGLEMPDLPPDRPRVIAGDAPAGLVRLPFPRDLQDRAQQLASRDRATMFMVLIAAFKIVLSRYTGSTDTSVGTPISNRPTADVEGLVGMFVNTLVFRTDLSGNPTFRELVGRVRATALAGYANQDLSFDRLVSALQPDRSTGRAPFFQVLFNLLVAPKPVRLAGLEFEPIRLPALDAQFDLDVTVSVGGRTPDDDAIALAYNAALFDEATMRRFGGHVLRVLERVIADPDGHIDDIDLLDETERRQLLVEWNATAAPLDPHETVVSRVQAQARATPDAVAVVCGEASMTYADLARRADEIARRLAALDLGPERIVGLCVGRSADMVAALLGILQAGAAYLPLDPAFPADRLAYMVEDSTATVVLTESALRETVPEAGARVIALDDSSDPFWTTPPPATAPAGPAQADRAYLLYTSGSTGKPKGVEIPHRAFVNFLASMAREPGMSASDRLLAVTTLSFDIAGLELFLPLVTGATVVVATRDQAMDPGALAALLASQQITVMQATPATWRLLLDDEWAGRPELTILCGGEAMTRELANRLVPRARAVWNMYGPTETTVWSTIEQVTAGDEVISIGRPIANTQVYVLDAARRPTPVGVPGELWIGGDGVATGYFRRPDLTAARFVPDPFPAGPGTRMYRTGDLARFRADGRLECLGRLDSQVKVRGFRIELGEIESVLAAAPGVRQAVAVVRQDRGEAALAAYLVPAAGAIDLDAAREHARQHLAPYMVPTFLVELAELPLTPNGKVDRKALPAPAPPRTAAVTPPANETEKTIAAVWAEVLGLPAVPVDENFFDLGGHSLLLAQVQRRLDDRLARQVPMLELFQYPTVRTLAARIDRAATTETAVSPAVRERMARQRAALERQRTARPLQGDAQ